MKQEKLEILCHRLYWQVWTDGEKNMSKYDKMLELNKRKSEEKVERAVLTIRTMVLEPLKKQKKNLLIMLILSEALIINRLFTLKWMF